MNDTPAPQTADGSSVIVIGAGPAGLTAAYELSKRGRVATVLKRVVFVQKVNGLLVHRDRWSARLVGSRGRGDVDRVRAGSPFPGVGTENGFQGFGRHDFGSRSHGRQADRIQVHP